jgi:hypothetical protein
MHITRKEAFAALVAGVVPWIARRAQAEGAPTPLKPAPTQPVASPDANQLAGLQKRVAALEAILANQVAFTKDAAGNLTLSAPAGVTIDANKTLLLKSGQEMNIKANGQLNLRGSIINEN